MTPVLVLRWSQSSTRPQESASSQCVHMITSGIDTFLNVQFSIKPVRSGNSIILLLKVVRISAKSTTLSLSITKLVNVFLINLTSTLKHKNASFLHVQMAPYGTNISTSVLLSLKIALIGSCTTSPLKNVM